MSKRGDSAEPARKLERLRIHSNIIKSLAKLAAHVTDLGGLLEHASRQMARATGVKRAKVMQYRPTESDLLIVAGVGWQEGIVGHHRVGADIESPPGRCMRTRQTVLVADIRKVEGMRWAPVLQKHGVVASVNAPVMLDGEAWGVLEVDGEEPDAFDEDDAAYLETFALVLGGAVARIRYMEAERQAAENLQRQAAASNVLMRESHHRFANNFQVILAMMSLKLSSLEEGHSRETVRSLMERIAAIAMAHDLLTVRNGQSVVSLRDYMRSVCKSVERGVEDFEIATDLDDMLLRVDQAVPLGIVLNELLTNALKYAIKDRPDGQVSVVMRLVPESGEGQLTVADNGPGMGQPRKGASGLGIAKAVAGQVGGSINVETSAKGTAVRLRFPLVG